MYFTASLNRCGNIQHHKYIVQCLNSEYTHSPDLETRRNSEHRHTFDAFPLLSTHILAQQTRPPSYNAKSLKMSAFYTYTQPTSSISPPSTYITHFLANKCFYLLLTQHRNSSVIYVQTREFLSHLIKYYYRLQVKLVMRD